MAFGKKNNQGKNPLPTSLTNSLSQFTSARVISVDQSNTLSNGDIIAEIMTTQANLPDKIQVSASPFFPNLKSYPLVNEVVFLITAPYGDYSSNTSSFTYYYFTPLNIWNNVNSNPVPNPFQNVKSNSQNKSLKEIEAGSPNRSNPQNPNIFKPGTYFTEKSNIFPLYPFEGDVILEGRFGNSLRFGSTDIAYLSKSKENVINKKFEESYTYPLGGSDIDAGFRLKLNNLNAKVASFSNQYDNIHLSVYVESSESQVTNPDKLAVGELAKRRASKIQSLLQSYSNLKYNIVVSTRIGTVPYTKGIDDPNNAKYLKDQYTTVKVSIQAVEILSEPSNPTPLNTWSNVPENGDPITILRNGQSNLLEGQAQSNVLEDVNNDISSIWLTSTQQVPLTASSANDYLSYGESENTPESTSTYSGPQIIINSGRLVFNTKGDHLMLSSAKSINLNAIEGIYMDTTGDTVFQSNRVYLGGTNNSQPVVLGDELVSLLTDVLNDLNSLTNSIQLQASMPAGSPLTIMGPIAQTIKTRIPGYQQRLKNTLSNTTKTV